jgi:hypothetical protein
MPSAWFRPSVRDAAPPSLHGVREGPFPRFLATMKRSDSRPSISPHFVAFAWRYHPCALFDPSGRDARPWAGELVFRFPSRTCQWRRTGLSGSRATLVSLRPVLGPR